MAASFWLDGSSTASTGSTDIEKLTNLIAYCTAGTHTIEWDSLISVGNATNDTLAMPVVGATLTLQTRNIDTIVGAGAWFNNTLRDAVMNSLAGLTCAGIDAFPLWVQNGCSNITFKGLVFSNTTAAGAAPGSLVHRNLVNVGTDSGGGQPTSLSGLPSNITWDRCIFYLPSTTRLNSSKFGIFLNGTTFTIKNCNFSGFKLDPLDGISAQVDHGAIWVGSANGVTIRKNYIESAGERVFVGQTTFCPKNIEFHNNLVTTPLSWFGVYGSKNGFECKNVDNLYVHGNVFENVQNYPGDQHYAMMLNLRAEPASYQGAYITDNVLSNVRVQNNIFRKVKGGIAISGFDMENGLARGNYGHGPAQNIDISNNLLYDVCSQETDPNGVANYVAFGVLNGGKNIRITNNTVISGYTDPYYYIRYVLIMFDARYVGIYQPIPGNEASNVELWRPNVLKMPNIVFTNNIITHHTYGVIGQDGYTFGGPTWTGYVDANSSTFSGNIIGDGDASGISWTGITTGNTYNKTTAQVLAEFKDSATNNYQIKAGSAFLTAGTGSSTPGVNFAQLKGEIGPILWDLPN